MKKVAFNDAKPYSANNHLNTISLRLCGKDETGSNKFWVGISHFLPGGGVEYSGEEQTNEKAYVVVEGEVTVSSRHEEFVLKPLDTLYIAPGEGRAIKNKSNKPASMLVVASY